ncbi:beta-lactamase family protein [Saprospiraceae bacterium]|nr:beta-lactamase family protein [Saprospiraceae bacterium]
MLIFVLTSCSNTVSTDLKENDYDEIFSLLLQENIDDSFGSMPGVSMSINSPLLEKNWQGAAGYADDEQNKKLEATQVFRIASVTKTFVAAAILRLHEMDSLSIEEPISTYIDDSFVMILKSDGYDPNKILIKHCLNHTSGLADYIFVSDHFMNAILKNPNKRWTRKQQLQGAVDWADKIGEPGAQTKYCDTGYILLGAIIEKFYDGDLAKGLRVLLNFDGLGLNSTWLETLEAHPLDQSDKVHRYFRKIDATDWDASIDLFGGGGLVSNTADLADFMYALFNNGIYEDPATLNLMLSIPAYVQAADANDKKEIKYYNYGLWTIEAFGNKMYMHNGYWGVTMIYIPKYNTSIAVNATRGNNDRMIKKVILVLEQLNSKQ